MDINGLWIPMGLWMVEAGFTTQEPALCSYGIIPSVPCHPLASFILPSLALASGLGETPTSRSFGASVHGLGTAGAPARLTKPSSTKSSTMWSSLGEAWFDMQRWQGLLVGLLVGLSGPIWQWVKTLYPCSSHQNSWDLWMFIPLKMVLYRYWSIAICLAPSGSRKWSFQWSHFMSQMKPTIVATSRTAVIRLWVFDLGAWQTTTVRMKLHLVSDGNTCRTAGSLQVISPRKVMKS